MLTNNIILSASEGTIISDELKKTLLNAGMKILCGILFFIIAWAVTNLIVKKIRKSKKIDDMSKSFIGSFVNVCFKIVIIVITVTILGVPTASFVAILTSAGIGIGLALQGGLSNIAGGIIILIFKPFKVGDYIALGTDEGTVIDINTFYTILQTPDNKHISIPNSTVSNSSMRNFSIEKTRRVDFTFSIAYGTDTERVRKILNAIATSHDMVLTDPAPMCKILNFGDNGIEFTLRVWTESANYWTVKFDINESVKKAFEIANIEIPFQQIQLHMKSPKNQE